METTGRNILDGIRVASPCPASWDAMEGDDRSRACASCGLIVYNLSALTTGEALELVTGREGRACVRFYRRADGTVMTSDCPEGKAASGRSARRKLAALGAIGLGLLAAAGSSFGLGPGTFEPPPLRLDATLADWHDWALATIGRPKARPIAGEMTLGTPLPMPIPAPTPAPPAPGSAPAMACEE